MQDNKNVILAIVLSLIVLIAWDTLILGPQREQQRLLEEQKQAELNSDNNIQNTNELNDFIPRPEAVSGENTAPLQDLAPIAISREDAIARHSRIKIGTDTLIGSINLTGGQIDDLSLKQYRVSTDPDSAIIHLLSPAGSPEPYYTTFGWVARAKDNIIVPDQKSVWKLESGNILTTQTPLILSWDNSEGLIFRRQYSIDDSYMLTVKQMVENNTNASVSLYPYAQIVRVGTPKGQNFFLLHEGLIGHVGEGEDEGLKRVKYGDLEEEGLYKYEPTASGWLGITDKYWATALIPAQNRKFTPRFLHRLSDGYDSYQADYFAEGTTITAGSTASYEARLFAGAKEVSAINSYHDSGIEDFDLMIDWGWFYIITKPTFFIIDWLYKLFGNFGLAILGVTILTKLLFFPIANKSYVSMANMKRVQPKLVEIRERYKDDRMRQQQAMMELYKEEKINPLAGCLPLFIQIPVFFAIYKVLFITIEMRHAPFFGWVQDLAAPDPTSLFNLFGLIPWDPPQILTIGVWPLIMGVTMFIQMRLNPLPPDRTQAMIFTWMPLLFTVMLASFPAGLVIYWACNNFLSIIQQIVIMRRQGVPVEIWANTKEALGLKKATTQKET